MSRHRIARSLAVTVSAVALFASACSDDVTVEPTGSSTTDAPTTSQPPTTSEAPTTSTTVDDTVPSTDSYDLGVYFVAEVREPAAGGVVDALAASSQTIDLPSDATTAQRAEAALLAVIAGPVSFESEIGFSNAVPAETTINGVELDTGIATVDLSAEFEAPSGALTDTLRVAQVVFTLTAFDDIDAVRFAIDGEVREVIGSHGVAVDAENGVVRSDLPEARPPILVERPTPGMAVADELTVRGEANTFEANVRWALTDPDGLILDEGFTTATAGNGTWGTFEFVVTIGAVDRAGLGAMILWEDSAEDGRQVNIVEVPISFDRTE